MKTRSNYAFNVGDFLQNKSFLLLGRTYRSYVHGISKECMRDAWSHAYTNMMNAIMAFRRVRLTTASQPTIPPHHLSYTGRGGHTQHPYLRRKSLQLHLRHLPHDAADALQAQLLCK